MALIPVHRLIISNCSHFDLTPTSYARMYRLLALISFYVTAEVGTKKRDQERFQASLVTYIAIKPQDRHTRFGRKALILKLDQEYTHTLGSSLPLPSL